MKKVKPIIIWVDQLKIDQMNEAIDAAFPFLQLAWDEFKKTPYF